MFVLKYFIAFTHIQVFNSPQNDMNTLSSYIKPILFFIAYNQLYKSYELCCLLLRDHKNKKAVWNRCLNTSNGYLHWYRAEWIDHNVHLQFLPGTFQTTYLTFSLCHLLLKIWVLISLLLGTNETSQSVDLYDLKWVPEYLELNPLPNNLQKFVSITVEGLCYSLSPGDDKQQSNRFKECVVWPRVQAFATDFFPVLCRVIRNELQLQASP